MAGLVADTEKKKIFQQKKNWKMVTESHLIDPLWNAQEWEREEVEENPLNPRSLIEYD